MKTCNKCATEKEISEFYKNQSTCIECKKEYYRKNKEKFSQRMKIYNIENKERNSIRRKEYYQKNKEEIKEHKRKYHAIKNNTLEGRAKTIFSSCRKRGFKYSDKFNITLEWIVEKLKKGKCEKTGITFDYTRNHSTYHNPNGPSIDRINPLKGYTTSNCQIVCNFYNLAKGEHTDEEFIDFCEKVILFNRKTSV